MITMSPKLHVVAAVCSCSSHAKDTEFPLVMVLILPPVNYSYYCYCMFKAVTATFLLCFTTWFKLFPSKASSRHQV